MRNKAVRRHHGERTKQKVRNYYGGYMPKTSDSARRIGMAAATKAPCSRACCGNPRKHWNEKTIQELRHAS